MFRLVNAFRKNATQIYFYSETYCPANLMLHSLPSIKFIAEKTHINRQSLAEKSDRLKHFILPSRHLLSCMFMKGTTVMQSSALRESKPSTNQLRAKFSVQSFQGDSEPFKLDTPPTYPPILVEATPVIIKNSQPAANSSKFRVLFSAVDNTHTTPPAVIRAIHAEFGPQLDVCATSQTAVCKHYFSPEVDGLAQKWTGVCWMNPPYGKELPRWMEKAYLSAQHNGATVICLVPARTDTKWWHDYAMKADEIRLIKGRLKFGHPNSKGHAAPFPSALVIFRP